MTLTKPLSAVAAPVPAAAAVLQSTISTWVSAHPALAKHLNQLPYFTQQRSHGQLGDKQRCAVCYRAREGGIKLFLFHGRVWCKNGADGD